MPTITQRFSLTLFSNMGETTTFVNTANIKNDDASYATTEKAVGFAGSSSFYPGYSLNTVLPPDAVINKVVMYMEARNGSGTADFKHSIRKYANGAWSPIVEWTDNGTISTSWTAKSLTSTAVTRADFAGNFYYALRFVNNRITSQFCDVRFSFMEVIYIVPEKPSRIFVGGVKVDKVFLGGSIVERVYAEIKFC